VTLPQRCRDRNAVATLPQRYRNAAVTRLQCCRDAAATSTATKIQALNPVDLTRCATEYRGQDPDTKSR